MDTNTEHRSSYRDLFIYEEKERSLSLIGEPWYKIQYEEVFWWAYKQGYIAREQGLRRKQHKLFDFACQELLNSSFFRHEVLKNDPTSIESLDNGYKNDEYVILGYVNGFYNNHLNFKKDFDSYILELIKSDSNKHWEINTRKEILRLMKEITGYHFFKEELFEDPNIYTNGIFIVSPELRKNKEIIKTLIFCYKPAHYIYIDDEFKKDQDLIIRYLIEVFLQHKNAKYPKYNIIDETHVLKIIDANPEISNNKEILILLKNIQYAKELSERREIYDRYNMANQTSFIDEKTLSKYNNLYNGELIDGNTCGQVEHALKRSLK